ncbi:hypothetical protein BegalDRAFT_0658 [Beggiatoa alba B18LD]|uniref:Uncharacterized protein n=1 Tax=Beggiatoa alba B18LD TaxID=395493 RepID=I3CD77_9GAMM|nr:hypothetical protein [Beggiatoa alba]EIJ41570.1 hypothetical protein BegalDRAFT_0658 [Beggiatoa alba B18LD]
MDFFNPQCQESLNNAQFGLCDAQEGGKAYINISNPESWIATVHNEKCKQLIFIAVDKCVIQDTEEQGRGRCDGILISNEHEHEHEHLYFIELKDQVKEWISDAIDQLESTILFFQNRHSNLFKTFQHKKAFACNKKRPRFQEIDNERNLRFFRTYGVRLDVQAKILII